MNVIQLVVSVAAIGLLMTPLFLLAFLSGRRSGGQRTLLQFDRLPADSVQISGTWRAELDGDDPSTLQTVRMEMKQIGGRIVATGRSLEGTYHFLEGVLNQRHLCCISIEENDERLFTGTLTAEWNSEEQTMVGMRTCWSSQSNAWIVRKATFVRTV